MDREVAPGTCPSGFSPIVIVFVFVFVVVFVVVVTTFVALVHINTVNSTDPLPFLLRGRGVTSMFPQSPIATARDAAAT